MQGAVAKLRDTVSVPHEGVALQNLRERGRYGLCSHTEPTHEYNDLCNTGAYAVKLVVRSRIPHSAQHSCTCMH
jgi:hypothetical protein